MGAHTIVRLPSPEDTRRSDAELMAACARGDTAALGEVFDRYHADVRRFALRMVGHGQAEADDLVQETFLAAFRSSGRYDGRSSLRAWLLGVAANVHRHHRRSFARRLRLRNRVAAERALVVLSPETQAADRQRLSRLEGAITQLSDALREAFVLCRVEGLKCTEVAQQLGVPLGTLYRRVHEAQHRLVELMK